MTHSRIASIIALLAAIVSASAGALNFLPPRWAITATAVCTIITSLNERVNGGASKPHKVDKTMRRVSDKAMAKRAKLRKR